jgi:hypothetical protein
MLGIGLQLLAAIIIGMIQGGGHSTTAALASGYVIVGSMYLSTSCFLARQ